MDELPLRAKHPVESTAAAGNMQNAAAGNAKIDTTSTTTSTTITAAIL